MKKLFSSRKIGSWSKFFICLKLGPWLIFNPISLEGIKFLSTQKYSLFWGMVFALNLRNPFLFYLRYNVLNTIMYPARIYVSINSPSNKVNNTTIPHNPCLSITLIIILSISQLKLGCCLNLERRGRRSRNTWLIN